MLHRQAARRLQLQRHPEVRGGCGPPIRPIRPAHPIPSIPSIPSIPFIPSPPSTSSRRPTAASKAELGQDEYNLLYVALTRAKDNLIINDALFFLLTSTFVSFSFERLELTAECEGAACVR